MSRLAVIPCNHPRIPRSPYASRGQASGVWAAGYPWASQAKHPARAGDPVNDGHPLVELFRSSCESRRTVYLEMIEMYTKGSSKLYASS